MAAPPPGVMETGAPAFVVLGPDAMGLSAAPTDLHLLPDGRILAVSQQEIAFSDGVRWEVFRAAANERPIVSEVAVDTDGEIYVGIEGGIARIDLNADSRWHLTPVVELPRPQFARSAPISVEPGAGEWFWYGGGGGVVRWRPGQTPRGSTQVPPFDRLFSIGNKVYLRDVALGHISEITADGSARLVPSTALNTAESITTGIQFEPGKALVGTTSKGLQLFDGTTLTPFPTNGWAAGHRITDLCAVGEHYFVAAIDGWGLVFFDRQGQAVQVLERSLDHRLGRVRRIFTRNDGVVWAILNDGVVRVEFPSPLSYFEPLLATGLSYAKPVRHEGRLWVQGDGNVMRAIYTASGRLERFEKDNPPGNYVFTLSALDGELFASNESGIFVHDGNGWKMAAAGIANGRLVAAKGDRRGWPYIARGEYGFLRRTPTGFEVDRIPAPQLGENYNAVTDAQGVSWIELGIGRAARLDPRGASPELRIFGASDGLSPGWVEAYILEGVARLHLPNYLWRYDDATKRLVEDQEILRRFPILRITDGRPVLDSLGRLWHTSAGIARLLERDTAGNYVERKIPVPFGPYEYTVQDDGVLWFFVNRRFSRLDLRVSPAPPPPLQAFITSVQFSASNRRTFRPGATLPPLDYADNSLVIHFAAPTNPFSAPVTFEVLLEGAGTQWVSTGTVNSAAFNRLKEGDYTFRVRPVVAGAPSTGAEARIGFNIRPPWFRTRLAWITYSVSAAGLIGFAAWLSSFLQRRENERLERLVANRTEELSRQIAETTEKSAALAASEDRFRALNVALEERVQQRTAELSQSNEELAKTYKNLVDASRMAGMAEVATGVLHNVGNVLNSLNVSSNTITTRVRRSKVDGVAKLAALIDEHAGNLAEFLTRDPKGKLVPEYIGGLARQIAEERTWLLSEIASMQKHIDHIKEIVAMQQGYATAVGLVETLAASELFEDAVRMNSASLERHEVKIVREYLPVPPVSVEKGKLLQILVNLIRNAKHACDDAPVEPAGGKTIVLRIEPAEGDKVRLIVRDNGIGIPPENLTRIFAHGFTTRSYGHGFGLHASAIAAKEMKGALTVFSAGPGQGATFTVEVPIAPDRGKDDARGAAPALARK